MFDLAELRPKRGRPSSGSIQLVRELTEDEAIIATQLAPQVQSPVPLPQRLRSAHHSVARLLAEGRKITQVALMTGYTPERIHMLNRDPAFQELIAHYKLEVGELYIDVHQRLADLGVTCIEELQQRLDEDPDDFTKRELMELAELAFDRSVAPPKGGAKATAVAAPAVAVQVTFVSPEKREAGGIVIEGRAES